MSELEKIRLNASKRQALKKEWLHTVYNNMHLQVDEDLKEAQRNFRSVRSDVWDKVITPIVEKNFPMADMKILQKYSGGDRYRYSSFTDTDRCFFFKPAFADLSETQFKWTMGRDEFNALYHYELQSRGHQATIRVEYEQTQRQENPHFHQSVNDMQDSYGDIAKSNGTYEDFALYNGSGHYCDNVSESDYGKYSKVVVSGSCHSRVMMLDNKADYDMLKLWAKAQSDLTNAHRSLWKEKYQLTTDMNSIIDQAKFIADVEQYWTNVRDCVNFENNDISKELSIVSDDAKARLSQAINNIDTGKPDTLVVASQNFSMVN
jgi:hypothetical protein